MRGGGCLEKPWSLHSHHFISPLPSKRGTTFGRGRGREVHLGTIKPSVILFFNHKQQELTCSMTPGGLYMISAADGELFLFRSVPKRELHRNTHRQILSPAHAIRGDLVPSDTSWCQCSRRLVRCNPRGGLTATMLQTFPLSLPRFSSPPLRTRRTRWRPPVPLIKLVSQYYTTTKMTPT